jgi:hypothetical protein
MSEGQEDRIRPIRSIAQESLPAEEPSRSAIPRDNSTPATPVPSLAIPPTPITAPPTPTLTPEQEQALRELTDSINELIAESIKIVIMADEEECARENKYNRPCDICTRITKLKPIVRRILRLSESTSRTGSRG